MKMEMAGHTAHMTTWGLPAAAFVGKKKGPAAPVDPDDTEPENTPIRIAMGRPRFEWEKEFNGISADVVKGLSAFLTNNLKYTPKSMRRFKLIEQEIGVGRRFLKYPRSGNMNTFSKSSTGLPTVPINTLRPLWAEGFSAHSNEMGFGMFVAENAAKPSGSSKPHVITDDPLRYKIDWVIKNEFGGREDAYIQFSLRADPMFNLAAVTGAEFNPISNR
jgi:hypothetical protein